MQVVDPKKASYGVENATAAVVQLAQTTMRSELGRITLDKTFEERTALNSSIVKSIQYATEPHPCPLLFSPGPVPSSRIPKFEVVKCLWALRCL